MLELTSDDGSRLWLGGDLVIDHDGLHGTTAKSGTAALAEGLHRLRIEWFNKTGGATLGVSIARAGEELATLEGDWLAH